MPRQAEYERVAADGTILYCCPLCTRMELNSYEAWLWHLGSREHQLKHSRCSQPFYNPRGPNRNGVLDRCVAVRGIFGLESRQVLDYLKTWGEVEDFCYHFMNKGENSQAKWCICLYRDKEGADACRKEQTQEYKGKELTFASYRASNNWAWIWGDRKRKAENERGGDNYRSRGDGGGYGSESHGERGGYSSESRGDGGRASSASRGEGKGTSSRSHDDEGGTFRSHDDEGGTFRSHGDGRGTSFRSHDDGGGTPAKSNRREWRD